MTAKRVQTLNLRPLRKQKPVALRLDFGTLVMQASVVGCDIALDPQGDWTVTLNITGVNELRKPND